jgi:hypothetical protein
MKERKKEGKVKITYWIVTVPLFVSSLPSSAAICRSSQNMVQILCSERHFRVNYNPFP